MSNTEIFDKIIENVSKSIINEYLTDLTIVETQDKKFRYGNNLNTKEIIDSLEKNVNTISFHISRQLNIEDVNSIKKILINHIESKDFKTQIDKLTVEFTSKNKLDAIDLKKIYYQHLKYHLMQGNVKEKIFALSRDDDFKDWLKRRWKIVIAGYFAVLAVLFITYYVFLNNK